MPRQPVAAHPCSTCIFRTDGNALDLAPGRLDEIRAYLIQGQQHQCHGPQIKGKRARIICRGGRDYQLEMFRRMGLLGEATDTALDARMVELGIWEELTQ